MLCKLWAILNNPSHPLHDVLDSHSSAEDSLHYNAPQNTTGHVVIKLSAVTKLQFELAISSLYYI